LLQTCYELATNELRTFYERATGIDILKKHFQ
jgi:hypothetical protein